MWTYVDYACRHAPVQRGQKGHGGIPSSVIIFCPTIAATDESGEDGSESESSRNTAHKTAVLIKGFTGGYAEVHFQICEMSARGAAVSEELRGHQTLFDLCSVALSSRHVEVKLRHLQCNSFKRCAQPDNVVLLAWRVGCFISETYVRQKLGRGVGSCNETSETLVIARAPCI